MPIRIKSSIRQARAATGRSLRGTDGGRPMRSAMPESLQRERREEVCEEEDPR